MCMREFVSVCERETERETEREREKERARARERECVCVREYAIKIICVTNKCVGWWCTGRRCGGVQNGHSTAVKQ